MDIKVEIMPVTDDFVVWDWFIYAKKKSSNLWITYKYGSEFSEYLAFGECRKQVSNLIKEFENEPG